MQLEHQSYISPPIARFIDLNHRSNHLQTHNSLAFEQQLPVTAVYYLHPHSFLFSLIYISQLIHQFTNT